MSSPKAPSLQTNISKGKARAVDSTDSEQTPLLPNPSSSSTPSSSPSYGLLPSSSTTPHPTRQSFLSNLLSVFFFSLSISLLLFLLLALLAYSYSSRASNILNSPDVEELIRKAVIWNGPESVDILNVTTSDETAGAWILVRGHLAVDAGLILGVNQDPEDTYLMDIYKSIGRRGINLFDRLNLDLSAVHIYMSTHNDNQADGDFLASMELGRPLDIPLNVDLPHPPLPPSNFSSLHDTLPPYLHPFSLPLFIQPTRNLSTILRLVNQTWSSGSIDVHVKVDSVKVKGGRYGENGWRGLVNIIMERIERAVSMQVPTLPGLPTPGSPLPSPSTLLSLQSFLITSSPTQLILLANATLENPIPDSLNLKYEVPGLPWVVWLDGSEENHTTSPPSLSSIHRAVTTNSVLTLPRTRTRTPIDSNSIPSSSSPSQTPTTTPPPVRSPVPVPIVSLTSHPFSLSTYPNISLHVNGSLLPTLTSELASVPLSRFLRNYLAGRDQVVWIGPGEGFPLPLPYQDLDNENDDDKKSKSKTILIPYTFPAPSPPPQVLRNLTLSEMSLKYQPRQNFLPSSLSSPNLPTPPGLPLPSPDEGGELVASGNIFVRVVLPPGVKVELEVDWVGVEVLIFDGLPEDEDSNGGEEREERTEEGDLERDMPRGLERERRDMNEEERVWFPWPWPFPIPHFPHRGDSEPSNLPPHFPTTLPTSIPSFPIPTSIPTSIPTLRPLPHWHHDEPSNGDGGGDGDGDDEKKKPNRPLPPPSPLPSPLPPKAFAHIRPDDWLKATSTPVSTSHIARSHSRGRTRAPQPLPLQRRQGGVVRSEEEGSGVEVGARFVDVPLEVLPGRDKEFRSFVGKVIFGSQGALAGVQGFAAVVVRIQGLPFGKAITTTSTSTSSSSDSERPFKPNKDGEIVLDGLPFKGSVRIGKKGLFREGDITETRVELEDTIVELDLRDWDLDWD